MKNFAAKFGVLLLLAASLGPVLAMAGAPPTAGSLLGKMYIDANGIIAGGNFYGYTSKALSLAMPQFVTPGGNVVTAPVPYSTGQTYTLVLSYSATSHNTDGLDIDYQPFDVGGVSLGSGLFETMGALAFTASSFQTLVVTWDHDTQGGAPTGTVFGTTNAFATAGFSNFLMISPQMQFRVRNNGTSFNVSITAMTLYEFTY